MVVKDVRGIGVLDDAFKVVFNSSAKLKFVLFKPFRPLTSRPLTSSANIVNRITAMLVLKTQDFKALEQLMTFQYLKE